MITNQDPSWHQYYVVVTQHAMTPFWLTRHQDTGYQDSTQNSFQVHKDSNCFFAWTQQGSHAACSHNGLPSPCHTPPINVHTPPHTSNGLTRVQVCCQKSAAPRQQVPLLCKGQEHTTKGCQTVCWEFCVLCMCFGSPMLGYALPSVPCMHACMHVCMNRFRIQLHHIR